MLRAALPPLAVFVADHWQDRRRDSWGRMASEALGAGVPAIVRRADCGTNHIAPGMVLVDSFEGLDAEGYTKAIHQARTAAQRLSEFVNTAYSLQRTRDRLLHLLRRHLSAERRTDFDRLVANRELARALDEFTVY